MKEKRLRLWACASIFTASFCHLQLSAAQLTWTEDTRASSPALSHHDMTYDSQRGALIVAGRTDSAEGSDVVVFAGTPDGEWSPLPSPTPAPAGRDVEMAYDADRNVTVLYSNAGNKVWELSGNQWAMKEATHTPVQCEDGALLQYDPIRKKTVLVGGGGWPEPDLPSETWLWDGSDWSQAAGPEASPVGAAGGGMAFDTARAEMVLVTHTTMQTWTFDGSTWTQRHPATVPSPGVWVFDMAYHPTAQRVVFFGGEHPNPETPWEATYPTDTWAWDGTDWQALETAGAPPANIDYGMAYFPERSALVMHGGWCEPDWEQRNTVWLLTLAAVQPTEIRFVGYEWLSPAQLQLTTTGFNGGGHRQILQAKPAAGADSTWTDLQTVDTPAETNVWVVSAEGPQRFFRVKEE